MCVLDYNHVMQAYFCKTGKCFHNEICHDFLREDDYLDFESFHNKYSLFIGLCYRVTSFGWEHVLAGDDKCQVLSCPLAYLTLIRCGVGVGKEALVGMSLRFWDVYDFITTKNTNVFFNRLNLLASCVSPFSPLRFGDCCHGNKTEVVRFRGK